MKSNSYDHKKIEKKWQKRWDSEKPYRADVTDKSSKEKFYPLVEFPFPSGEGLHTGHLRSYTAMDIIARKRRMQGYEVLFPIGWDAFGLPTENYAIKTGLHPKAVTKKNTANFTRQLKSFGFSFDWDKLVDTSDPAYYKWTQWIFIQMFKAGLAYKAKLDINWCPKDKIGLANEEVVDGKCERCGTAVERREKEQWVLAITKYADRLYDDLDTVDYLERIKIQQRNWIGPSKGSEIDFGLDFKKDPKDNERRGPDGKPAHLTVFTTRADTLFGVTYLVLSPDHPWVRLATDDKHDVLENKDEVKRYVESVKGKTEIERTAAGKEKTGVRLKGVEAINPANSRHISIWVADYVLAGYGTGAVMAVPAHDERDLEFAKKYDLPIKEVIRPMIVRKDDGAVGSGRPHCFTGDGILLNSGKFDRLTSEDARTKITKEAGGRQVTIYKLRDWIFSRQRYWGEPIPLVHCEKCGWVPIPEKDLPLKLPNVKKYQPTDNGESPLSAMTSWVKTKCLRCKGVALRETDTMPQWAGSSWYYLRYIDPKNKRSLADAARLKHWLPVDWYNGGMEHTTLHLLYSRFWHKFLYDIKVVPTSEPYQKRTAQGMILANDGEKMSKSRGNVVSPDEVVNNYGADTVRVYEMFMGPFDQAIPWNTDNMIGSRRFIERVWNLRDKISAGKGKEDGKKNGIAADISPILHPTIKKVGEDIERMAFNTAVSSLMILLNSLEKETSISKADYGTFLTLAAPFAPHVTEELWSALGNKKSIHIEPWPEFDPKKLVSDMLTIVVQINGKVRATFKTEAMEEEKMKEKALALPEIKKWLDGRTPKKVIYVKGKLVSVAL